MKCPTCTADLTPDDHEQIPLMRCRFDHGVWLDPDQLRAIVRSTVEDKTSAEEAEALRGEHATRLEPASGAQRPCPECAEPMRSLTYAYESGVLIDSCDTHGIWLDQGELARIEAWYEGSDRVADAEVAEWQPRLDAIERDHDRKVADDLANVHMWGVSGAVRSVARFWLNRDDASRHRNT